MSVPIVEVSVSLLPELPGPRVLKGRQYRPHIVMGPAHQKAAVVAGGSALAEKYLGVCFWSGVDRIEPGETVTARLALMYHVDSPDLYEDVIPGAEFTVREGPKVVGFGTVLRREEWSE